MGLVTSCVETAF